MLNCILFLRLHCMRTSRNVVFNFQNPLNYCRWMQWRVLLQAVSVWAKPSTPLKWHSLKTSRYNRMFSTVSNEIRWSRKDFRIPSSNHCFCITLHLLPPGNYTATHKRGRGRVGQFCCPSHFHLHLLMATVIRRRSGSWAITGGLFFLLLYILTTGN